MPQQDMTKSDSSRIQSTQAKNGGDMTANGFAARALSAGDKYANSHNSNTGNGGYGAFGSGFGTSTSGGNAGSGAQGKK